MALVDSEVVFKSRCDEIGITGATYDKLKARGWATFGSFAFSVSTNPSQISDDDFESKVVTPILVDPAHIDAAKLRRLLFESYTMTASELRRKAESTESDTPKKLPAQEIAVRFQRLEAKLNPLKIESVMDPSHQLINNIAQCLDDGRLRYIEWARCTTRAAEVNNIKEDSTLKVWKADSSGHIKQSDKVDTLKCDVGTDLEVLNALKRRGVAYEIARVMSFEFHERIVNLLFQELQRDAPDGFRRVSMSQVASADREIHLKLADLTRGGLPMGPLGELPLDTYVDQVLALPSVMWLLMPKPKGAGGDKTTPNPDKPDPKPDPKIKKKKINDKLKKARKMPMPSKLRGGVPVDDEGKSICFGYNLNSCKDKNCKRGKHVCCYEGCYSASHTFLNHPKE